MDSACCYTHSSYQHQDPRLQDPRNHEGLAIAMDSSVREYNKSIIPQRNRTAHQVFTASGPVHFDQEPTDFGFSRFYPSPAPSTGHEMNGWQMASCHSGYDNMTDSQVVWPSSQVDVMRTSQPGMFATQPEHAYRYAPYPFEPSHSHATDRSYFHGTYLNSPQQSEPVRSTEASENRTSSYNCSQRTIREEYKPWSATEDAKVNPPLRPRIKEIRPSRGPKEESPQSTTSQECPVCLKSIDRKGNLNEHLKTHHADRSRVPCPKDGCDKTYGRSADLGRHIRAHHRGDRHNCRYCGKDFNRSDICKRHESDSCPKRKFDIHNRNNKRNKM